MKRMVFAILAIGLAVVIAFQVWPRSASHPVALPGANISHDTGGGVASTPAPRHAPTQAPTAARRAVPTATRRAVPTVNRSVVPTATTAPTAKNLVLIVLDGAQPSYFNVPGTPNLHALIRKGASYTNGFAGILESETPSGHASIASGSLPNRNGILSFEWASNDNTTYTLFNPQKIRDHSMEHIIQSAPAPDIAGLVHKSDPKAKVVVLGGHKYYAQDALGGPEADVIMYYTGTPSGQFVPTYVPGHAPPAGILNSPGLVVPNKSIPLGVEDHLVTKLAVRTTQEMHQRVLMMNYPEFDWPVGHVDGGMRSPAEVKVLMQGFDQELGQLEDAYRKAGMLNQTVFVITADHGMAPIYHTVDQATINNAVAQAGTSIIQDSYHTAAYLWLKDHNQAAQAAENLAQTQNRYIQSVYFKSPVSSSAWTYLRATGADLFTTPTEEHANQYLLSTFNGPNSPDLVVFFTENSASLPGGEANWKGDHGGNTWNSQHLPLLFSGPGVKPGAVSAAPAPLEDIAPTALSLLGIPDTGMQGVALADGILQPHASAQHALQAQTAVLKPVIDAMKLESQREIAAGN